MRKTSDKIGGAIEGPLLRAALLFLIFSPVFCHAQDGVNGIYVCFPIHLMDEEYFNISPELLSSSWIQGQTLTVSLKGPYPINSFPINSPTRSGVCTPTLEGSNVMLTAWEFGPTDPNSVFQPPIGPEYPYVTFSNFIYVNPLLTTFTVSIANDAPPGGFYLTLSSSGTYDNYRSLAGIWKIYIQPKTPPPQPPPPPVCPTPVLTAVTPDVWVAGKTYNPKLTGTGFTNTVACPAPTVNITDVNNNSIPYSNATVTRDTEMIVTAVVPPASNPTETVCVTLGNETAIVDVISKPASAAGVTVNNFTPSVPGTAGSICTDEMGDQGITVQIIAPVAAVITDTSDIMDGNVTVNLTAPSGTTGDLNLDFNGSDASALELSQAPFTALSPGEQELQLPFDTILPGIYTMANGSWDALVPGVAAAQSVTVSDYTLPTPWTYFRKIFYTQYNVPHESACGGGDADAWLVTTSVVKRKTTCNFTKIKLNAAFIRAAWMNGAGVDLDGDILKNAVAVNLGDTQRCAGQYPAGAIGHGKAGGNTFEVVSSITGSCNATLVAGQSVAMPCTQIGRQCPVAVLSGVQALSCGDQLNLDSGDHTSASTRIVEDLCPACSNTSPFSDPGSPMYGADGHIDAFSSNTSCTGKGVGSLGFFYTSYPTN